MIQENYKLWTVDEAIGCLHRVMMEHKDQEETALLHIFEAGFSMEEMQPVLDMLDHEYPKLKRAGLSMGGLLDQARPNGTDTDFEFSSGVQEAGVYAGIKLNLMIPEKSRFEVVQVEAEGRTTEQIVEDIIRHLDGCDHLAAVELLPCGLHLQLSEIVDQVSKGREEVCFFGSSANGDTRDCWPGVNDQFYSIGQMVLQDGITLVLYSGEHLCVHAENLLGWHPVGRKVSVTTMQQDTVGDACIVGIDGMPPKDFYRKYLGVGMNEFFVHNICEFPLVVERDGALLGRIPCYFDEEGRLYFMGDIREDEKIQLSYGNRKDVLIESLNTANRMTQFGPDAMCIHVCGNRNNFLKKGALKELRFFENSCQELFFCHGLCEIYRWHGQGGILNSALVVVGFKECDMLPEQLTFPVVNDPCKNAPPCVIPLEERMSVFLKAITSELEEAAESANAANAAKSAFLSNMSHEIRTPINAVLGMDEMILRESTEEKIIEYAEDIRNAGNNLLGIINDVLDFSKIEAQKMEVVPVEYELASVLNDLVNMIRKRAEDKGLVLNVECDPKVPHLLVGDEIRIKQVITNILTNAVKYTEKGSVTLKVGMGESDGQSIPLKVCVEDTGIGMREEEMDKLFSAFERLDLQKTRNVEGTGLGMSITTGLLELMGSRLEVESTYGVGSAFHFTLRQQVINWEPIGDFEEAMRRSMLRHNTYHEKFKAPEAKVLVVDDTPMNLTVVKGLLKQTQIQIDTAQSGRECLRMTNQTAYDIIFLDHRMPEMDGIETLRRLKADAANPNRETTVVALTANAVSGARKIYFESGFDDYLSKPIDSDKLENMLIKYLPSEKVQIMQVEETEEAAEPEEDLPESVMQLSGIVNIKEGVRNCGDANGYLQALQIFARSADSGRKEIQEYYDTQNWKDYTTKVHALKSSARIIGAASLSALALELEESGNGHDIANIQAKTAGLLEQYQKLGEQLQSAVSPKTETKELPRIDPESLTEAYRTILELSFAYDYNSILFVLKSLEGYRIPEEEQARYEQVKEHVHRADWEQLRNTLNGV